ncbi:Huntingtin-interacting protein M [Galemys pyrenaicus]|uniref:Huntingtin-interacting protein M n=1 Tax=Galemys pyrenaicus TaxID=202257 RepID=A0A8J6DL94_GALPY|nr:Huntingtin-interacting protein M [Galemys pyrenaicus]
MLTAELHCPVSFVDRFLKENQYPQRLNSSSSDFHLTMLDHLTDYILEMVGNEVNSGLQLIAQDAVGPGNNREPHGLLKNSAFSLFDQIPGSRKSG